MPKIHNLGYAIPPDHLALLEAEMASKPGDWFVVTAYPGRGRYTLSQRVEGPTPETAGWQLAEIELDVSPILDLNAFQRSETSGGKWGDGKLVARIPVTMMQENGALEGLGEAITEGDKRHVARVLNSSDWSKLRTFEGNV